MDFDSAFDKVGERLLRTRVFRNFVPARGRFT